MPLSWAQVERLEHRQMPALVVVPVQVAEGTQFNGPVATFSGNEVTANNVLDYTARVEWGDGSAIETAAVTPASGGGFVASGHHTYARAGLYNLAVVLNGLASTSVTAVGTATVTDVPPSLALGGISATANTLFSGVVATFTDPGASPADQYVATINWGDGSPATTGVVAAAGSTNAFTISGAHTFTRSGTLPYSVSLKAPSGVIVSGSANAVVADPPPVVTAPAVVFLTGLTQTRVVATFTDADPTLTPASFAATIDWADGSPTSAGVIAALPGGGFNVSGTHNYATAGSFANKITVVRLPDNKSAPVATGQIIVNNPVLTITKQDIAPATGLPFTGIVASFTDNNPGALPSDYTATINWGDGHVTPGVVSLKPGGSGFNVVGTNTYTTANTSYPVVVTVARLATGQNVSTTGTATVADAVLTLTAADFNAVAGQDTAVTLGTLTDTNPSAQPGDYTVVVNWGDGSSSNATVAFKPGAPAGTFSINGAHRYTQAGTYNTRLSVVRNANNQEANAPAKAVVAPASTTITATGIDFAPATGLPFSGIIASFNDSIAGVPADYSATINWGDGTSSTGTVSLKPGGTGFNVAGTHTYTTPNTTYAVQTTIRRLSNNAAAIAASKATVADAVLTLTAADFNAVAGQDTAVTLGTLTDTNPSAQPGDYTVVVNWGDGSSSNATVAFKPGAPAGTFSVNGTHNYAQPGSYSVRVIITAPFHLQPADKTVRATVAAATTSITPFGTTLVATAGAAFSGTVGSFTASPPTGPGAFVATIDWGDGQTTAGQVVERSAGAFDVVGSHVYGAPSPTAGATPYYAVKVSVVRAASNDTPTTIASRAVVSAPVFTGRLSPLSDTGISNSDGITRLNQPTFIGTAPPFAVVQLYTRWSGQLAPVTFGRTIAGADGSWLIAAQGPLLDGAYAVSAVVTPATGTPVTTAVLPPLIIDTTPPHVTAHGYDSRANLVSLSLLDDLSGLDPASLARIRNYSLIGPSGRPIAATSLPRSLRMQAAADDPQKVVVTIEPKLARGSLRSVRVVGGTGGVSDVAGNLLAGNGKASGTNYVGKIGGPAGRFRRAGRRS